MKIVYYPLKQYIFIHETYSTELPNFSKLSCNGEPLLMNIEVNYNHYWLKSLRLLSLKNVPAINHA